VCLNETYSRVRVGKHLSDMFPIRNGLKPGDEISPLPLNFALDYAIKRVRVKQVVLKLNGNHQLLFMLVMLICWAETYILERKEKHKL
jgi:hypothetical protein